MLTPTTNNDLWVEKYRPTSVKEYVFQDGTHETSFKRMIADQSIPHLLLSGVQGTGKTTIAEILINALKNVDPMDILRINASLYNSVDTMRDQIHTFVASSPMGDFKVVLLEEADYMSPAAQAILRRVTEEYSNTARFILTCNHPNKISAAIRSRCQEVQFKAADIADVTEMCAKVLLAEGVTFDLDVLDRFVSVGYPDMRKILNTMQFNTNDNVLHLPSGDDEGADDYRFSLLDLLEKGNWEGSRKLICQNITDGEWEDFFRFMYDNLIKVPKFEKSVDSWEAGIIIIAEHLYQHSLVADPEINAAAMMIRLSML